MDWRGRGGAGIRFVEENIEQISKANMVILMISGNDIDNGMVDRLQKVAKAILREGPEVVGIASIWPRQDTRFNKKIKELEEIMYEKLYDSPQITYWR